jgi:hypothetical protein
MPWLDRAARIAEVSALLEKAEIASGYRLDSFIQLLAGDEAPAAAPPVPETDAKKKTNTGKGKKRNET